MHKDTFDETSNMHKGSLLYKDICKKDNPLLEINDDMMSCKVCIYVYSFMFVISIYIAYDKKNQACLKYA